MTEQSKKGKSTLNDFRECLNKQGVQENQSMEPRAWVMFPGHPLVEKLRELHRSKNAESDGSDSKK